MSTANKSILQHTVMTRLQHVYGHGFVYYYYYTTFGNMLCWGVSFNNILKTRARLQLVFQLQEFICQIIEFQLCVWFILWLVSPSKTFKKHENEKNKNWFVMYCGWKLYYSLSILCWILFTKIKANWRLRMTYVHAHNKSSCNITWQVMSDLRFTEQVRSWICQYIKYSKEVWHVNCNMT